MEGAFIFEVKFDIPKNCHLFRKEDGEIDASNIHRLLLDLCGEASQVTEIISVRDDGLTLSVEDPYEILIPTHYHTPRVLVTEIIQDFATVLWTVDGWNFQPGVVVTSYPPERYNERYGFIRTVSFREENGANWTVIIPTSHTK